MREAASTCASIASTSGLREIATAPTQSASVDTSIATPSRAKRSLWRCSGRCSPYLETTTSAKRWGPARPRAIGWNGAGASAIAAQERHETFSRPCWITKPACRHALQALGHHLAELAHGPATARAGRRRRVEHARAWQVFGKRTPGGLATGEAAHRDGRSGVDLCGRFCLGAPLLQILQREFELRQPRAAFGRWPEPLALEPGNLQLETLDLEAKSLAEGARLLCPGLCRNPGRALGQDHRLGTGEVGRKRGEDVCHRTSES